MEMIEENGNSSAYGEEYSHTPVMLNEVLEYLDLREGLTIVDCTLGGGGHALEICKRIGKTGRLIGIEQDIQAMLKAKERLKGHNVTFVHDNFRNLDNIIKETVSSGKVDGFLFDLGVSSFQLDDKSRGFSFMEDAFLDMRMDQRNDRTAADIIDQMTENELTTIFLESGYGRWARKIARAITTTRKQSKITTTAQLTAIITAIIKDKSSKIHPATKAFQAVRIAVNDEIAALHEALITAVNHSNTEARIAVLSYHSLEDGETKRTFRLLSGIPAPPSDKYEVFTRTEPEKLVEVLTKKPVEPSENEVKINPRSRSAKLRAAKRI